jgi:cell division protein FtsQ
MNSHSGKGKKKRAIGKALNLLRWIWSSSLKVLILMLVVSLTTLTFLTIYNYLIKSPYLKLERLEIQGVDDETRSQLLDRSGLDDCPSLLAINLNVLKKKMEEHPWVRSVQLERRFPHTLIARVEKERPVALVSMGKIYYMNRWGEAFKEVRGSEGIDFPLITGFSKEEPKVQEKLKRVAYIIKALESEGGHWSLSCLSEVNIKEDGLISLYFPHLKAEIKLMWYDLGIKMDELKRVTRHLRQTGQINQVANIDLTYMDGAVISFKRG